MKHEYELDERVEVRLDDRWYPAVVRGEKFNGGNGGFYSVDLDDGRDAVLASVNIRKARPRS